jgi:hypothetical protein
MLTATFQRFPQAQNPGLSQRHFSHAYRVIPRGLSGTHAFSFVQLPCFQYIAKFIPAE